MSNANQPAVPCGTAKDAWHPGNLPAHTGLTKREDFAKAMAVANRTACPGYSAYEIARMAVIDADALLAELERTGGNDG